MSFAHYAQAVTLIFGGCCSNVYTLEALVGNYPECGHLITFSQFLVISLIGLRDYIGFNVTKNKGFYLKETLKIPLFNWLIMVGLFFTLSVINNHVFSYKVSVPVHIIFRSNSLIIGMIFSRIIMKKRYSFVQIVGVSMVTAGVILSTIASSKTEIKETENLDVAFNQWLFGIFLIGVAVILSSILGIYQEMTYSKYGKEWKEGLLMNHILGLPFFGLFHRSIVISIGKFNETPSMWLNLFFNVSTQYVCVAGVHKLSANASSVTLNLVLSLRKVVSLLISVILFGNPFTLHHALGLAMVTFGTFCYTYKSPSKVHQSQDIDDNKTKKMQ